MSIDSERVMRAQRRKKMFAVEQFGGKCQICGYDKCISALDFHHVDKTSKKENPAYVIMRWSWKKAKTELEKCILVCSNCHREIHFKSMDISLMNLVSPWIEVECQCCKKKFSTKINNQRFCSNGCRGYMDRKVVNRPTKEDLEKLINDKVPWLQMGRMFGVTDNAVRKWARKYGILASKL